MLELPEGAPRIREDFTYVAAESAGDPPSAATHWFSINLTVCCVNRSLRYLDTHFAGIVDLFDLAVGGPAENHPTIARSDLETSRVYDSFSLVCCSRHALVVTLPGQLVDLDGMPNPRVFQGTLFKANPIILRTEQV